MWLQGLEHLGHLLLFTGHYQGAGLQGKHLELELVSIRGDANIKKKKKKELSVTTPEQKAERKVDKAVLPAAVFTMQVHLKFPKGCMLLQYR